ncbi:MAG: carbohydrate ABC transporter permease [Defluviitaleaceae bacterium]|nr:carbohydrate ABC transporter permease [Defluviitaleaceae bacterium]
MKMVKKILIVGCAALLAVAFALPIFITITNSFMTGFEILNRYSINILPANSFYTLEVFPQVHFVRMTIIPDSVSVGQYLALFRDIGYMNALWNSVIITMPAVLGQLVVCVPAAYAFEFSKWRHKEKLFFIYLVVMLMPLPVLLVPQFVMAVRLGISESVLAIILPAVFAPFGVFLLRQFLKTLPVEFIEAAKIDGAGQLRILISIVAPLLKPAIAALAILVFVDYWNVVDQAIVFITDFDRQPLSVYLSRLTGNFEIVFAASCFYMIPALLVFLHGQEYLVEGMRMSGLK